MEKRVLLFVFFALFLTVALTNFISSEIILSETPNPIYNLGDTINQTIRITSPTATDNTFTIKLLCGTDEADLYKEYLFVPANGEVMRKPSLPLVRGFIGNLKGNCKLEYSFGMDVKLTDVFTISDKVSVTLSQSNQSFDPGKQITLSGKAVKEDGNSANGISEVEILGKNGSKKILASGSVNNGEFSLSFSFPKDTASSYYLLVLNVTEKDSKGEITNTGSSNYNIFINQIPTSLEIFFENPSVNPGETLRVKTIIHDQTGQAMGGTSDMSIINSRGKILRESNVPAGDFLEFTILDSEPPATWSVKASAGGLTNEIPFNVNTVESIKTDIVNKTLIITNTGNVPYNKTVSLKIGMTPFNLNVALDVGQTLKYTLTAPDGKYNVEISADGKDSNSAVFLTGDAVDVKATGFTLDPAGQIILWVLAILILGFIGLRLFRKWHKRSFHGYPKKEEWGKREEKVELKQSSVTTKNKAELSLSIKGEQQNVSVICLKIKNLDRLKSSRTNYEETIQSLVSMVEEQKAVIYGNQENIFFILAPIKTKTFKNERTAIDLAEKISEIINAYNKLAREKINAGISVNYGTIVATLDKGILKFMSLGTLMNNSKKLASLSDGEVLLSEEFRTKIGADVKTQKKELYGVSAYTVKEVRDDERSKEFIRRFMHRMEEDERRGRK